jgi:hypothetical protein
MQTWIRIAAVAAGMALAGSRSAGAEAAGLGPYLSPAQLSAEMKNLEADYPGRAEVFALGRSAGGRPLEGVRISRGDDKTRAEALVAGNIHGDEPIGNRTAMAVARFLLEADGRDPLATQVLDRTDVYVIPLLNPDGDAATYDSQGRAPVKERRPNGRQVDLNRNFPRPGFGVWLPLGYSGSHNPKSTRYNGPQPLSEPETRAVRDLAAAHRFFADVDFHCAEGMIIPAKCKSQGCYGSHQAMAKAYSAGQSDRYSIFNRPPWMPIYQGNMEDFLLDEYGALSLLIELGSKKERPGKEKEEFWKMNPRDPAPILENNVRATLSAILKAYEITGGKPLGTCRR